MAKGVFKIPNFNAFIADTNAKKEDLDVLAERCITAAQGIQFAAMRAGLARHKRTGAALKALQKNPVQRDGNRTFAETGITLEGTRATDMNGFWAAWFQEYGAARHDSGKVLFKADPWLRPAIDGSKSQIKAAWKKIFTRAGYPMK